MDNTRLMQLALENLELKKAQIESEIASIRAALGGPAKVRKPVKKAAAPPRRTISAAVRKARSERMKAYWIAKRKEKTNKPK